ncbi:alcohol dehydrogenase catalytic domain-containing protein [Leucobacter sp. CSA1]|uniref:Alcohol dehydrogenase catalytic domain-containing protein n=1 Tax=Leucobacter chromiisoli TaxID=2796471 RepID=A0A934Q6Z6_9MICO|nr:alcohol dehydrogenase catalytic domain-containing protein [Leucobacter chromiisoli]MBK0419414.1 alcohol dehydrogenase catalytic domain-containing protein [Leucobacter chromiisoli]
MKDRNRKRGTRLSLRHRRADGLALGEEPVPELEPHEARVRVLAVGLCGTDAHILAGQFPSEDGIVLGHEVCGVVTELGSEERSPLSVGDLVALEPHRYCAECSFCRIGKEHLCVEKRGYGVRLDGGMTTDMVVPRRVLYRVPDGIDPLIGAMAEPLACCLHAMDRLSPVSGESILVAGCGPAGAMLVALARSHGLAPIVVLEPSEERRRLALDMGADAAFHPDELHGEAVAGLADGEGFRYVVDAVGRGSIARDLLGVAKKGGTLLIFGVADREDRFALSPRDVFERELTIVGSVINPYTHGRSVALLERLPLERIPARVFPLEAYEQAFAAQREGREKIYISPHPEALAESRSRP